MQSARGPRLRAMKHGVRTCLPPGATDVDRELDALLSEPVRNVGQSRSALWTGPAGTQNKKRQRKA
jgi:hypothetical protein